MDGSPSTDPTLCFKRRKYLIIQKTSTSRSSSSNKVQKKNDDEADEKDGPSARRLTNKKTLLFCNIHYIHHAELPKRRSYISNSLFIYQDENEDENQSIRSILYVLKQACDERTNDYM